MKTRSSHPPTPTPAPSTSPLDGFKFSTIGQNPTLLNRMGENIKATLHTPSPEQEFYQDRTGSSHSLTRRGLSWSMATGAPSVERDSPMNSALVQHQQSAIGSNTTLSAHSEFHDARYPHYDQQRASVIPDLQYPNVTQDNNGWPSFAEQSAPRDQSSVPPHQPSIPRNSSVSGSGSGLSNGPTGGPATPSSSTLPQHSDTPAPSESEQLRRLVEQLIKLASLREDRMSRQREIFGLRSGELSTFSSDAAQTTKSVQDQMELLKLQAEDMRAQAGQMLQEANKTREMADRLIASVESLNVEVPNASKHVDHLVERSEQMISFFRKIFDWLATLRGREQEKVEAIQAEFAEHALAELNRTARMQELQRQLERRKAEELEREKAARREEEEREAARKKAEEEAEVARKEAYEAQRAAVMAQKRRANEEHAQYIQAERERRLADVSGSSSTAPPTVSPDVASEHTNNARVSTSLSFPPVTLGPAHSPVRGKGPLEVAAPFPQPPPSPNKARAVPAPVFFVPAKTEVGRTVNTDSPLSSTTLASELHPRIVQPLQRPPLNHPTHASTQDQMLRPEPRRTTPKPELRAVEIKREPSIEELPTTHPQALPSQPSADLDEGRQRHVVIPRRTPSQDENGDQRNQALSRSPSRANSLYVAPTEEQRRRSDPSAPVPPEQARPRDPLHGRAADVRGYTRQDSTSSDRSSPRWNDRDRRSRSPVPRRPLSRSPSPYSRKRVRSGSPRYDSRQPPDQWKPQRSQCRSRGDWARVPDRDRGRDGDRQSYDYDRERQGDSPRRYRHPPPRRTADTYRPPSHSPAPLSPPRQYRYERSSPRPVYHDRSLSPEYATQRFSGSDAQDRESERINTNARHYEATSEAEVRHPVGREEQQRWQRPTPSPSDRDRTPTPPPRSAEVEVGLLDRIDMNEAEYRGRGRGRLQPGGVTRGGPNTRRGMRGGPSGGRGRGVASGSGSTAPATRPAPALLTRMTGTTTRGGARPAHAPSLSDRMQQD
ncbi:hypothetical protein EI94DRAFT_1728321 [Lactarius quietus]|nr:hypothetical protein EI94DRAFT_1728321 [Lactarius quietus]